MTAQSRRVAWVTGASSGIGKALARALSDDGWRVIVSGRREDALRAVAEALPGEAFVLPFEATDFEVLPAVVDRAMGRLGSIDLLVNNAGVSQRSLALDTDFAVYRELMEVDFFAPLRLTQLVLPAMVERGSGGIIAISSLAGRIGSPLRTGYCAAKHALLGYFEALRAEVEGVYGVKVLTVLPGSVRTAVATNALLGGGEKRGVSDVNIDNGMDPNVVAGLILGALADGRREIVIAEGAELGAATLRVNDPERLWAGLSREGDRLAAARSAGGAGFKPEPRAVGNV